MRDDTRVGRGDAMDDWIGHIADSAEREDVVFKQLVGPSACRLTIPMLNEKHLQQTIKILSGIVDGLKMICASDDPKVLKIMHARFIVSGANKDLKGGKAHFRGVR